jgi:hypothetical protein
MQEKLYDFFTIALIGGDWSPSGDWTVPRAAMDILDEREISYPCWES